MFDLTGLFGQVGAETRELQRLNDYVSDVSELLDLSSGPITPVRGRPDAIRKLKDVHSETKRRSTWNGGRGIDVDETDMGRIVTVNPHGGRKPANQRFDVITIGGWSQSVAGVDEGWDIGVETVNGYYGERNHVLAEGLTREQVEEGSWSWGRGDAETHFAIAAVVHNSRGQIPHYVGDSFYNLDVPRQILYAQNWEENNTGGEITLTLTFYDIQD